MEDLLILAFLLIFSSCLTGLVRFLALKKNWFDIPNSRSSHASPIPKSGGLGFLVSFYVLVFYLYLTGSLLRSELIALGMGLLVALIGLIDDFKMLKISTRLTMQFIAGFIALISLGGLPVLPLFSINGTLGIIWLVNLYNFMDGIDGLAALEACFICIAVSGFAILQNFPNEVFIFGGLLVSIIGFLVWNFPVAKIFMGDVGSNFLGFIFAVLGLITISHGFMNIWSWFIVDTTMTLIRRISLGEVWYYAHRSHAYQHAAVKYSSHKKVDVVVSLINIFWLFPLAWVTVVKLEWAMIITLMAYIPLIVLGYFYKAGNLNFTGQ
jgi:Fuc2NAc and GlcNAc transferase